MKAYLIDSDTAGFLENIDDEEFKQMAEEQNTVYDLETFQKEFNTSMVNSYNKYLRFMK